MSSHKLRITKTRGAISILTKLPETKHNDLKKNKKLEK